MEPARELSGPPAEGPPSPAGSNRSLPPATRSGWELRLREIGLFVMCHEWVVALDADSVERIVPTSQESLQTVDKELNWEGFVGMLQCAGDTIPAWDLGKVLGLGDVDGAWVLLRRENVRLALRTGKCLSVGRLSKVQALPPGIFEKPDRRFFSGAFHAKSHVPATKHVMFAGLVFDPSILWTHSEQFVLQAVSSTSVGPSAVE